MMHIIGNHRSRPALLEADFNVSLSGTFCTYFMALDQGNVDGIVNTFREDGYVRTATNISCEYQGKNALHSVYSQMLQNGGSPLELATGTIVRGYGGFEYNCVPWCREDALPKAGLIIIREEQSLIASAHLYDDVTLSSDQILDKSFAMSTRTFG